MEKWEQQAIMQKELIGRVVTEVKMPADSDEGFELVFDNSTLLVVKYSSCEGDTKLNGRVMDSLSS